MLKKYKNRLLQVIQEKGIDPKLFQIEELQNEASAVLLQLKDTELKFIVRNPASTFDTFSWSYTKFVPNFEILTEPYPHNIDTLVYTFENWTDEHIKRYLNELVEPDMWERIEAQAPLVNGAAISQEDTNVFSDDEKIHVRMSINEFRILLIKNFKPTSEEIEVINDRLEYLSNSVDRLNKIDWRSVAIMTLIAISTTLSLDTEKGRILFDLFKQVFSNILQLMQ